MSLTIEFKGIADVEKTLRSLGKKVKEGIAFDAIATALQPVVTRAKFYAMKSDETGNLRDSIGMKARRKKSGNVFAIVGPRRKFERANPDGKGKRVATKYGHLVEFGTSTAVAKPFLRPAWDAEKERVVARIGKQLGDGISAAVAAKKAARKSK